MYRYADAFRCSRRNFLCFEESCRDLTQRPVRVDEKCLWREFSVFPYDGINTPDSVSQQYPELTKLCLRYFAQDKNTDSFRKQQAVPRFFSFRRFILENLRFLYRRPFQQFFPRADIRFVYFNKSVDKYINLTNRLLRRFYRGFSNDLENVRNSLLCVIILSNNPCQKQRQEFSLNLQKYSI